MPAPAPLPRSPNLKLERAFEGVICGVDEAGCAPLAGPVVAAAVVLPPGPKPRQLRGLNDSKLLGAEERERFFALIHRIGRVGVGMATVAEIDQLNIFHADMLAMRRAVEALGIVPDVALVDGRAAPPLASQVIPVIKGDRRSLSIAAASVIAKVVRDRLMHELARSYPGYGWKTNVGYGTDVHYLGLLRQGPTEHHRRSFAPLNTIFGPHGLRPGAYSFRPVRGEPDLAGVSLLLLRQDLHAVFDGGGHHIGVLKKLRGRWSFRAIGYRDDERAVPGGGPCAACHGNTVERAERQALAELLRANLC